MGIIIRQERAEEQRIVENVVREAFWNVYKPGCVEHYVLHVLRQDPDFVPEMNYVLEKDGTIIGQVIGMRAVLHGDDGRDIPIVTIGPIGILPAYKRQGYGKLLLDFIVERATELGFGAMCFEGNHAFYSKSGFTYGRELGLRYHGLPEGADDSFFLGRELIPGFLTGVTGVYETPKGYYIDEAEAEAFDTQFPPKEKLKLPGQIFG